MDMTVRWAAKQKKNEIHRAPRRGAAPEYDLPVNAKIVVKAMGNSERIREIT